MRLTREQLNNRLRLEKAKLLTAKDTIRDLTSKLEAVIKAKRVLQEQIDSNKAWEEVLHHRSTLRYIADKCGAARPTRMDILTRLAENKLLNENRQWREFAWLSCPHQGKYGDDGEMQCQGADFRRADIATLSKHLHAAMIQVAEDTPKVFADGTRVPEPQ